MTGKAIGNGQSAMGFHPRGVRAGGLCLDVGGKPITIVAQSGREYRFELSRGGFAWVNKNGEERSTPVPLEASWAVAWWQQQGEVVDDRGVAVWSEPPPQRLVRLAGNQYRLAATDEPCDSFARQRPRGWTGRVPTPVVHFTATSLAASLRRSVPSPAEGGPS